MSVDNADKTAKESAKHSAPQYILMSVVGGEDEATWWTLEIVQSENSRKPTSGVMKKISSGVQVGVFEVVILLKTPGKTSNDSSPFSTTWFWNQKW